MNKSEQINELAAALSKAQGMMKPALKDADNPFYKSKYADLSAGWEACREALAANGLSVAQIPEDGGVHTLLMHTSGQWLSGFLPMIPTKNDPQGIGSAITYGRRYALFGMLGIAPEDDDGNAASGKDKEVKRTTAEIPLPRPNASVVQSLPPRQSSGPSHASMADYSDTLAKKLQESVAAVAEQKAMPKPPIKKPLTPAQKFHVEFRNAMHPKYQVFADQLLKDWLDTNYPEYGGSVSSIPGDEMDDRKAEACKYANTYAGQG